MSFKESVLLPKKYFEKLSNKISEKSEIPKKKYKKEGKVHKKKELKILTDKELSNHFKEIRHNTIKSTNPISEFRTSEENYAKIVKYFPKDEHYSVFRILRVIKKLYDKIQINLENYELTLNGEIIVGSNVIDIISFLLGINLSHYSSQIKFGKQWNPIHIPKGTLTFCKILSIYTNVPIERLHEHFPGMSSKNLALLVNRKADVEMANDYNSSSSEDNTRYKKRKNDPVIFQNRDDDDDDDDDDNDDNDDNDDDDKLSRSKSRRKTVYLPRTMSNLEMTPINPKTMSNLGMSSIHPTRRRRTFEAARYSTPLLDQTHYNFSPTNVPNFSDFIKSENEEKRANLPTPTFTPSPSKQWLENRNAHFFDEIDEENDDDDVEIEAEENRLIPTVKEQIQTEVRRSQRTRQPIDRLQYY